MWIVNHYNIIKLFQDNLNASSVIQLWACTIKCFTIVIYNEFPHRRSISANMSETKLK